MMKLKPLVCMMAMLPAIFLPATTTLHASDLSIYRGNTPGKTNILLMLDTSGSMGISSLVLPNNNKHGSPGDIAPGIVLCERVAVPEHHNDRSVTQNMYEWKYNLGENVEIRLPPEPAVTEFRFRSKTKGGWSQHNSNNNQKTRIYYDGKYYEQNTNGSYERYVFEIQAAKPERLGTEFRTAIKKQVTIGNTTISYYVRGCTAQINGQKVTQYDRLSRLKEAIIPLLASNKLSDEILIGLGQFSSKTELSIGTATNKLTDSHSGRIMVPVAKLTQAHRILLAQQIASIKSLDTTTNEDGTLNTSLKLSSNSYPNITKSAGGTPTAHAYAEAGAYMLGASTGAGGTNSGSVKVIYDGYMVKQKTGQDGQVYLIWTELGTSTTTALGATVKQCPSDWPEYNTSAKTAQGTTIRKPRLNAEGGQLRDNSGKLLWDTVTFNDYKKYVSENPQLGGTNGVMNSLWDVYKNLPIGWRFDGWMRVEHEPMDIEPIVGTVWGYPDSIYGLVSYRTSPFELTAGAENNLGGLAYSVDTAKNVDKTAYSQAGSTDTCDGNGIYFLTDGAPNSTKDTMAQTILNHTLGSGYKFSEKPNAGLRSPALQSNLFTGETGAWEYIGEYAKKLRNLKTTTSPLQKNQKDMAIKTAVVGFGASFAGLTKNPDGTYDCSSAPNEDAKNACLWGGANYGDGGFYYAEDAVDIANSIVDFVGKVGASFEPTSMGTISVPRDPLDQTQMLGEGFFPMIVPLEAATVRTWIGNLKKYKIEDGTLKDASGNAIYTESATSQSINKSAKDLWSNAPTSDDHSSALSGGALNNIPVTSLMDSDGEFSKDSSQRNLFIVDFSGSATDIKQIAKAVTKESLATDYSPDDGEPEALSENITAEQRYALLNYLGYKTAYPPANLAITSAILREYNKPNVPYRFLGGVVHSTPLMVTKSATLKADGTGTDKRDEYVVYGSFEGGLHIVDARTGEEKSVFVPEEILRNQTETLANPDAESENGLAYGVDAPWALDSAYKVTTETIDDTTTTSYKATRLNIYGGLRMGGEALYGLNIENPSSPKLLFHITPSTSGFERMGQIWAKPTVTEILVKGKRKRVLIFGGGYDADIYEKPADVFVKPTAATKGNALYIVEADTGNFIASVSSNSNNSSTVVDSANDQSDEVKYSVVGQPVVRDYNADGLADMIYFADLGGQIFRIDLNNNAQFLSSASADVIVRTKRIAHLATNTFTPRFYERLTTAVFNTDSGKLAVLVTAGSGNRSYPLEAENAPNSVYGILDYDAAMTGLEKSTYSDFQAEATAENLAERGKLGVTHTSIKWGEGGTGEDDKFRKAMTPNGTLRGWMLQLANTDTGNVAKSMEESQLIAGDLYVNVYDPNASLSATGSNQCGGGVKGLSTIHRICTPYADCAAYVNKSYQGIVGPTLGKVTGKDRASRLIGPIKPTSETCVGNCTPEGTSELPEYSQKRTIKPTRWFEW